MNEYFVHVLNGDIKKLFFGNCNYNMKYMM